MSLIFRISRIALLKFSSLPLQAVVFGLCLAGGGIFAQTLPLPANLINFNSTEGEMLLLGSSASQDYLPLSTQFVTQKNPAYCGVASSVMVLNALLIKTPAAPESGKFSPFTQDNFFNAQTEKVVPAEVVARQGMTLEQLGKLLASHSAKVRLGYAGDLTLADFRKIAVKNLQEPGNFVIVNYLRKTINQETGGHISPLAAYNQESDRFLILDVSGDKYPPVWVKATELWQAMATVDAVSGKTRGFVVVRR